jgi:hypothetical protein
MKTLIAVALVVTAFPALAAAAGRPEAASNERRHCTQITVRAGSRMSGRRICRTAEQWREALGPDWRQHLAGYDGVQDDYDAMQSRVSPGGDPRGVQGQAGGGLVARAAGPH